jgi:hypothetical protein
MSPTKNRSHSAWHEIAWHEITMRGLAAVSTFMRHWRLQPDGETPGHIEPGPILALTGFSGIWDQEAETWN